MTLSSFAHTMETLLCASAVLAPCSQGAQILEVERGRGKSAGREQVRAGRGARKGVDRARSPLRTGRSGGLSEELTGELRPE